MVKYKIDMLRRNTLFIQKPQLAGRCYKMIKHYGKQIFLCEKV